MNRDESHSIPLACNAGAFDAERQGRYRELVAALQARVEAVVELPNGYAFQFPSEAAVCQEVMEFATLERLCCPFLVFHLELAPGQGPLTLSLTGPTGAKAIVAAFLWRTPNDALSLQSQPSSS